MNFEQIYNKLATRPHNQHHLKRYVRFMESRQSRILTEDYVEGHHIIPKAKDMFPEYEDFCFHPWNEAILTGREHILAHVMLWLAFPEVESCLASVYYFFNVQRADLNPNLRGRVVPIVLDIRYRAKLRQEFFESKRGKASYKTSTGEIVFLRTDDPRIQEEGLVGFRDGILHDDATKAKMRAGADYRRVANMRFLDMKISVPLWSPKFDEYLSQGWTIGLSDEDREYNKIQRYNLVSELAKGKGDYMFPDGTYAGKFYPDDQRIKNENLRYYVTEAKTQSALNASVLAAEANTGSIWYNNGIENKRFHSDPGGEWKVGQLVSDEKKTNRSDALRVAIKGKKTYNDGKRNYFVGEGDFIDPSWKPGMAPQKKRQIKVSQTGAIVYNDGVKNYRIFPGESIDPSWKKGMLSLKKREYWYNDGVSEFQITSGEKILPTWKRGKLTP